MAEVWAGDEPCIQRAPSLCPRAGLTKQARIYTEGEVGRLSNGHGLTQIYITSSEGEEPSLEELSSGSTEIVSVRSRRGGRSQSAERILEEERGFTRSVSSLPCLLEQPPSPCPPKPPTTHTPTTTTTTTTLGQSW